MALVSTTSLRPLDAASGAAALFEPFGPGAPSPKLGGPGAARPGFKEWRLRRHRVTCACGAERLAQISELCDDSGATVVPLFGRRGGCPPRYTQGMSDKMCALDRGTLAQGGHIMTPGSVFQLDFIVSEQRWRSRPRAVSLTYSLVLVLDRERFFAIIEPFPEVKAVLGCARVR